MSDICTHSRLQCSITGFRSFPVTPEDDGVILLTAVDLSNFMIVEVETICHDCGKQRVLETHEWEVA